MKTNSQLADDLDCIASEVNLNMLRHQQLGNAAARLRASEKALKAVCDYFEVNGYDRNAPVWIAARGGL